MTGLAQTEQFLIMKRLLLWILLSVLVAPLALATTNYINNGVVSVMSPPMIAPQIDASNFVNNGLFYITNVYGNLVQPPLPYETWNTRNWTNANRMAGDSGFRFDYFDSVGGTNGWSANFQNAGNVSDTNANIFGSVYVRVFATNINNKGTMTISGPGLMTLNGKTMDLTRGTLGAVGNETNDLAGVRDLYWGVGPGTNIFSSPSAGASAQSFPVLVTDIQFPLAGPPFYGRTFQFLQFTNPCGTNIICTNGYTAYVTTRPVFLNGTNFIATDVLFLRQTNPAISTDVRFASFGQGAERFIQWQALQTNRVNGVVTTNRLFLTDTIGDWFFPPFLVQTPEPVFSYTLLAAARFRPSNYSITHAAPSGYDTLPTIAPTVLDPSIFNGTNVSTLTDVAWAATITAAAFPPEPTISNPAWTNVPGRIEITASGTNSYLNLTRTLIDGESYLLLSSTNHFVGCTNAAIKSPVSDIYLSSTNGSMAISNLTTPFVPRMEGVIQAWSGRWMNVTAQGVGTFYTVTMIDSALAEKVPSQIQNLSLRSTNLLIGDALNVFGSLLLDTSFLTISTNAVRAPTPNGELNLTSGDLWWSGSLPRLQCLTNLGKISSVNSIYFGSNSISPPWFSGIFEGPYQSMVTHGLISSVGCSIWAKYFEASGTNDTGTGPLTLQADSAIVTNGAFLVSDADITFTCGSLLISNQLLEAGRSISLTVTNYLDDGSLTNSVNTISNQNTWTVGGGINLWLLPPEASLLATTVTNTAFLNAPVDNNWAAQDFGGSPSGFVNNAALGRLILNGQDDGSLFNFFRTGPTNALYVDLLELKGATINADSVGNFIGVNIDTNFTIYYGDAIVAGHSIAEKLNGKHGLADTNGGRFVWVSNYNTGFFSSTNVTYTDGSVHRLNRALVYSCSIDSNGQPYPPTGGVNATCDGTILKPDPIPVLTPASLILTAITVTETNPPGRSIVLSWNTIPLSSNYLYSSPSLLSATNWQLVTSFLSADVLGGQATVRDAIKTNGPHYYRVRALSP
jgi:hypothetical protein